MTALSYRPFLIYFITNSISLLGLWVQKIGVGWLTWHLTESTFWTSFVTLALMAPAGVLGPIFAVWVLNKGPMLWTSNMGPWPIGQLASGPIYGLLRN